MIDSGSRASRRSALRTISEGEGGLSPREELEILIRARYPIIYVITSEEERVESCLKGMAAARNKQLFIWTVTQGMRAAEARSGRSQHHSERSADPLAALDAVVDQIDPAIFLLEDFHPFTSGERCNISIIRRLRDAARHVRETYKTIVITAPLLQLAPELAKDVAVIDFGLPQQHELSELLDRVASELRENSRAHIELEAEARARLLQAARGLTLKEAENVLARSLVVQGKLDGDPRIVFSEKRQIIRKSGLLEYCDVQESMDDVAGLEHLKGWLEKRTSAFGEKAAEFGLPTPRGVMLLGVQGCGKSLCAKSVASLWQLPLLRFDLGRMFSSLVGSSEENIRLALQTAENVAPVVLWIDEIDKALAGCGASSGSSDAGTAARVFGTLVTWLSEKSAAVFVVATANEIQQLPPELLRKGRFDDIFFVDLPSADERREIFRIHLSKRGRDPANFNLEELARSSDGFNGAELEEGVIAGLFEAFSRGTELSTELIQETLNETVPLSKTMSEELDRLRKWAVGRARPASRIMPRKDRLSHRRIEL